MAGARHRPENNLRIAGGDQARVPQGNVAVGHAVAFGDGDLRRSLLHVEAIIPTPKGEGGGHYYQSESRLSHPRFRRRTAGPISRKFEKEDSAATQKFGSVPRAWGSSAPPMDSPNPKTQCRCPAARSHSNIGVCPTAPTGRRWQCPPPLTPWARASGIKRCTFEPEITPRIPACPTGCHPAVEQRTGVSVGVARSENPAAKNRAIVGRDRSFTTVGLHAKSKLPALGLVFLGQRLADGMHAGREPGSPPARRLRRMPRREQQRNRRVSAFA
jgi:hypothetical protein